MLAFVSRRCRRKEDSLPFPVCCSLQAPVLCLAFAAHSSCSMDSFFRARFLQSEGFSGVQRPQWVQLLQYPTPAVPATLPAQVSAAQTF